MDQVRIDYAAPYAAADATLTYALVQKLRTKPCRMQKLSD